MNLKGRLKGKIKVGVAICCVGGIAIGGFWTGTRKLCDVVEAAKEAVNDQYPRGRASIADRRMAESAMLLLDISHMMGHQMREKWDRDAYRSVMTQFKDLVGGKQA